MIAMRRLIVISVGVLLAGLVLGYAPAPVFANAGSGSTTCGGGGNPSVTACVNGHNGEKYVDAYMYTNDNDLNAYADGYSNLRHINNSMWLITSTDYSTQMEMGNYYGYGSTQQSGWFPGGSTSEEGVVYWADNNLTTGVGYAHYIAPFNVNDGVVHNFEIDRDQSNICYWDVYYDGQYSGQSHLQNCPGGYSYAYEDQVGLEYGDASGSTHATWPYSNTVSDKNLKTWYNGAWKSWSYMYTLNTEACSGSTTVDCFNGTNTGVTDVWQVNRPR